MRLKTAPAVGTAIRRAQDFPNKYLEPEATYYVTGPGRVYLGRITISRQRNGEPLRDPRGSAREFIWSKFEPAGGDRRLLLC